MRLYIALLVGLQGCGSADRTTHDFGRDPPARQAAEAEVSSAAVAEIVASNRPAIVLVVKNRALWFGDSTSPAMAQPAWADFVRQAREPGVVPTLAGDSAAHRVGSWDLQSEATDTAVIALSGVGFSPAGDEAVVFMDYRCGTRCGVAAIGTFRRRGASWVLSKADTTSRH